jgi:hypothetical protein
MATSGLRGPFPLTDSSIDTNVTKVSPGAYALGNVDQQKTFRIAYVGRSDVDVNDRLHDHVGKYTSFKYEYYKSPDKAYEKQCSFIMTFRLQIMTSIQLVLLAV